MTSTFSFSFISDAEPNAVTLPSNIPLPLASKENLTTSDAFLKL